MKINRNKQLLAVALSCLLFVTACPFSGSGTNKTRTLAKATDDFAQGQKSIANLLSNARTSNLISQEDINEIKPFLLHANDLNSKAIEYGRKLLDAPEDQTSKEQLISTINEVSATLVRANNAGLLRIKDKNTQVAFSALIVTLLGVATTAITVIKK